MTVTAHRIAVVLDGPPTPAWQARALASLEVAETLDVVAVRLAGTPRRSLAGKLHDAIERHIFRLGADPLAPTDVAPKAEPAGAQPDLTVWLIERPVPENEPTDILYLAHDDGRATDALLRHPDGTHALVERTVSLVRPFSATLSRDLALWKLAALVVRAAERAPGLERPLPAPAPRAGRRRLPAFTARAPLAWARVLATRLLFRRPWSIRVRQRAADPTQGWETDEQLVRWGDARTYADPILFEHEGRHHLFCEVVPAGAARGVISHTELKLDGTPADPPRPVLEADVHLSYPFVFPQGDGIFMIPETSAARRVELYRATTFPHAWEREATLLDGLDAADATLLEHDKRLWLFASVAAPDASSLDELHVFWADALRGPWHPHPRNPVVSDARCARPAGPIQRWEGRLVRPGQDGSRRYGGAISFRQIDVLTTSDYAEHEVARLEPGALGDARATHAYSADSRFEAIDLRRREPRLQAFVRHTSSGRSAR